MSKLFANTEKVRKKMLEFDGEKYEFEFRSLNWKEDLELQNECFAMSTDGQFDIDLVEASMKKALKCIVKAPFDVTRENLEALDEEVGGWIEKQLNVKSFRSSK